MVVSDLLSFGNIDSLAQAPGMAYPENPPLDPQNAYRVSAIITSEAGKPAAGVNVHLYRSDGKTAIDTRITDTFGRVYFDYPNDTEELVLAPEGAAFSPPYARVKGHQVAAGFFTSPWSWNSNSVKFTMYAGLPGKAVPSSGASGMSAGNMLLIGLLLVGGYFAYTRWVLKGGR